MFQIKVIGYFICYSTEWTRTRTSGKITKLQNQSIVHRRSTFLHLLVIIIILMYFFAFEQSDFYITMVTKLSAAKK